MQRRLGAGGERKIGYWEGRDWKEELEVVVVVEDELGLGLGRKGRAKAGSVIGALIEGDGGKGGWWGKGA